MRNLEKQASGIGMVQNQMGGRSPWCRAVPSGLGVDFEIRICCASPPGFARWGLEVVCFTPTKLVGDEHGQVVACTRPSM